MQFRPQTLTGAGARFLRECTELMHVAVIWASAEVAERAPQSAKRLRKREGRTYLRLRNPDAARMARDATTNALQEMTRLSGEATARLKAFDAVLMGEIKRIGEGSDAVTSDQPDGFDCCDITTYQHILRQHELVLMSCLAEFHTQSAAYWQQFYCDHVCEQHPCTPEVLLAAELPGATPAAVARPRSRRNQGVAAGS